MPEETHIDDAVNRIEARMRGVTSARDEAEILDTLAALPDDALDPVLSRLDLDALLADLDDRVVGPDYRARTIELLAGARRDHLSAPTKAALIHAMQSGPTRRKHEHTIRDLILGLHGSDLVAFKNLLNGRDDHHDLEKLVFDDIDHADVRQAILDHIRREGQTIETAELKILCDIDDTVQARLHEKRYPRGTVYPGVAAFIHELEHHLRPDPGLAGDLTFITARPMDVFGLVENYTRNALDGIGMPAHTVLSGSFLHLLTHDSMADKKIENFNRYRLLFPESGVVFIGDSGQGDIAVGQRMLEIDADAVQGVFIHDVRAMDEARRRELRAGGIRVFDTYIGAAIEAQDAGVISAEGVRRVADAAMEEFSGIRFGSEAQRAAIEALLARDLARVESPGT